MRTEIEMGGAITIVNGIARGIGSTIGTEPVHKIIVEDDNELIFDLSQNADDKLVNACLRLLRDKTDLDLEHIKITTDLKIPPARGMKSSSIVATGLIAAISKHHSLNYSEHEIINLGADAAIQAGVSITGAIDDAYGSYSGGFVVTHNLERQIMAHHHLDLKREVIFLIPEQVNIKSDLKFDLNFLDYYIIDQAVEDALRGDWKSAIEKNSRVYAQFFLQDWDIINEIEDEISGTVGLNGAGPSLFVLTKSKELEKTTKILQDNYPEYMIQTTKLRF